MNPPGSSKSWNLNGLSEKSQSCQTPGFFQAKLLEIDCHFWKWFAHLKRLENASMRYLTEGTLQFRNSLNQNCSPESESLIQNSAFCRLRNYSEFAPLATNCQNRNAPHLKLSAKHPQNASNSRKKKTQAPAKRNKLSFRRVHVQSNQWNTRSSVQSCTIAGIVYRIVELRAQTPKKRHQDLLPIVSPKNHS